MYEIATGERLFPNVQALDTFVAANPSFPQNKFPYYGDHAKFLFDLLHATLAHRHSMRPGADNIVQQLQVYRAKFKGDSIERPYSFADKRWLKLDGQTLQVRCILEQEFSAIHEV